VSRSGLPTLAFGAIVLLSGGPVRALTLDEPAAVPAIAADVMADLERDIAPRSAACPDPALYSPLRPDPAQGPTFVGLALFFQDVASFSDLDQTLDADVYVVARWRDSRLADPARGDGSADCPVPQGRLWMPALEPESLRGRQQFYAPRFLVNARGVVTLGRRVWVKVANPLDFRDFPLDRHRWLFTIWPIESRADEMVFHPLQRWTGINERVSIQGWRVGTPRARASEASRVARSGRYARFDVELGLERRWGYYAWKLGLPLTLISLMAYGVYFLPNSAVSQQVGLGMTSMLTLIAYMLTLGNTLPRIAYLTRADRFFVGSALLVFLGLVKALTTTVLVEGPREALLARANRYGRWLFPLAMIANFALAFLV
jgi:hypothetical protein